METEFSIRLVACTPGSKAPQSVPILSVPPDIKPVEDGLRDPEASNAPHLTQLEGAVGPGDPFQLFLWAPQPSHVINGVYASLANSTKDVEMSISYRIPSSHTSETSPTLSKITSPSHGYYVTTGDRIIIQNKKSNGRVTYVIVGPETDVLPVGNSSDAFRFTCPIKSHNGRSAAQLYFSVALSLPRGQLTPKIFFGKIIKQTPNSLVKEDGTAFLPEADLMPRPHPNLISPIDLMRHDHEVKVVFPLVVGVDAFVAIQGLQDQPDDLVNFVRELLRDASCGLQSLHEDGIIHLDPQTRNLIVDLSGTTFAVKVGDLGCATPFDKVKGGVFKQGQRDLAAPELGFMNKRFFTEADVFYLMSGIMDAVGVEFSFDDEDRSIQKRQEFDKTLRSFVLDKRYRSLEALVNAPHFLDLCVAMTHHSAWKRIKMHEITTHPFFGARQFEEIPVASEIPYESVFFNSFRRHAVRQMSLSLAPICPDDSGVGIHVAKEGDETILVLRCDSDSPPSNDDLRSLLDQSNEIEFWLRKGDSTYILLSANLKHTNQLVERPQTFYKSLIRYFISMVGLVFRSTASTLTDDDMRARLIRGTNSDHGIALKQFWPSTAAVSINQFFIDTAGGFARLRFVPILKMASTWRKSLVRLKLPRLRGNELPKRLAQISFETCVTLLTRFCEIANPTDAKQTIESWRSHLVGSDLVLHTKFCEEVLTKCQYGLVAAFGSFPIDHLVSAKFSDYVPQDRRLLAGIISKFKNEMLTGIPISLGPFDSTAPLDRPSQTAQPMDVVSSASLLPPLPKESPCEWFFVKTTGVTHCGLTDVFASTCSLSKDSSVPAMMMTPSQSAIRGRIQLPITAQKNFVSVTTLSEHAAFSPGRLSGTDCFFEAFEPAIQHPGSYVASLIHVTFKTAPASVVAHYFPRERSISIMGLSDLSQHIEVVGSYSTASEPLISRGKKQRQQGEVFVDEHTHYDQKHRAAGLLVFRISQLTSWASASVEQRQDIVKGFSDAMNESSFAVDSIFTGLIRSLMKVSDWQDLLAAACSDEETRVRMTDQVHGQIAAHNIWSGLD